MPPKLKLHRNNGKLQSFPKPIPTLNNDSTGRENTNAHNEPLSHGASSSETETIENLQQKFEVELYWCIHKLQDALSSNKLQPRQVKDSTKALKVLTSKSTPVVQKRQQMRATFGDYRKKMAEEEEEFSSRVEEVSVQPVKPSQKSVFVKKSVFSTSGSNFKFNFPATTSSETIETTCEKDNAKVNNSFHFSTSDNSFRFNFS